ncbi:MAG: hypothetical protein RL272_596 [Candidatus Parcubacteria bacterium]
MKFGEKVTFKIEGVDKKGRGVGSVNGRPALVPFAVPGEEVEAVLVKRRQGKLRFSLDRVVKPSPRRIGARCRYAGTCGGCAWQQFDYGYQLELKRGLVNDALEAAGIGRRIEAVVPAASIFDYRNRMDYCIGPNGELGLKEPGRWNACLDLEECHLLSPESVEVMRRFREYMRANGLEPWDAFRHTGYARYLVIREGKNTGERMVTVVTSEGGLPASDALVASLGGLATTVYHGVNPEITDLSTASRLTILSGQEFLHEKVAGKTFAIHPNSFFQTNTAMAETLVGTVRGFLADRPPAALLDLYCGVGLFGICLADAATKVVGVEIDPDAIVMAKENASKNGVANAEYYAAKAESLVWEKERPDAVIIDPPRAGLHPKVVKTLLERRPERIAYVSCNYESFAREWAALGTAYDLARIEALDLFPHSPHVELASLLTLKRKKAARMNRAVEAWERSVEVGGLGPLRTEEAEAEWRKENGVGRGGPHEQAEPVRGHVPGDRAAASDPRGAIPVLLVLREAVHDLRAQAVRFPTHRRSGHRSPP